MIKFVDFLQQRKINVGGVLHIGAHMAEEESEYLKLVSGKDKIIWVEANPELAEKLCSDPERIVKSALITDKDNDVRDFIITSFSQSNSVLELAEHKKLFPWVHEIGRRKMLTSTIDSMFLQDVIKKGINMLTMDIQGAELLALKGADKCLHYFDIIYTEINITQVYKNCVLIGELDSFLADYGFYRAETLLVDNSWGDSIYLKKSLQTCIIEGEDLDRVWNMLKPNVRVLVDVGARGSEYPAGETQQREYHLFDPNPKHHEDLIKMYGNDPNVFISDMALGDQQSEVTYYPLSESINPRFFGRENVITVKQDTLDNYCEKMGISRINFLKIDTEGHELKVMKGGTKMLEQTDYILFEYGGTYPDSGITFSQVYDLLSSKGFNYIYYIGKNCLLYQPIPVEHKNYSNYIALRTTWKEACRQLPNLGISCINLESSTTRREFTKSQIDKIGLHYEIFDAVDGKKIDIVEGKWAEYMGERFVYNPIIKNGRNKLSYGEIGCFLSHILLVRKMLKENHDFFLILEDDNEIVDSNLARLQLMNIPETDFDLCLFSASMNCHIFPTRTINNYYGYPNITRFNRANAVLYSRRGLEKILEIFNNNGITMPYDDFLEFCNLNIIIPKKFLYKINDSLFKSDIWNIYKQDEKWYDHISHDKPLFHGKLTANLNGYSRMGNCLFQYAFLKAQEIEKGMTIVLSEKCHELSLFPRIRPVIGKISNCIPVEEKKFAYDQELCDLIQFDCNYFISGYFQSYKYFRKYDDVIKGCFQIDPVYMQIAKRNYVAFGGRKLCGVHIRLPDTKGENGFIYTNPSEKYLSEAIHIIQEKDINERFFVCSSDISECIRLYKHVFPSDTIFSNFGKYEDFALLSFCDDNIITAGSYGWWAAYLNKNPNKTVIGMRPNFNQNVERVKNNDERDYYPSEWIILDN